MKVLMGRFADQFDFSGKIFPSHQTCLNNSWAAVKPAKYFQQRGYKTSMAADSSRHFQLQSPSQVQRPIIIIMIMFIISHIIINITIFYYIIIMMIMFIISNIIINITIFTTLLSS